MLRRRTATDPGIRRVKSLSLGEVTTQAKSLPVGKISSFVKVSPIANKKGVCSRILTPKQVGPICWFMAAFVAMFYSQRSRKILLEASKGWDTNKELFSLLKHVLDDNYLKTASRESEDYLKFSDDTFINILRDLNVHDPLSFPYNPETNSGGFFPEYYIGKLYGLLNVDYKIFDYNKNGDHLFYSYLNDELNDIVEYKTVGKQLKTSLFPNKFFKYIEENMDAPKILMVIVRDNYSNTKLYQSLYPYTIIGDSDTKNNITSMNKKIFYSGSEYHLDSVILSNWNRKKVGHAIAGITCKKRNYIYNGWTRASMDPAMAEQVITRNIPCELMKYDWNVKEGLDFCLHAKKCIPDILKNNFNNKEVCFNFSKGSRILVYVRKDVISATSSDTKSSTKEDMKHILVPLVPSLQAFFTSLSYEVDKGTNGLVTKIVDSYSQTEKEEITDAIHRYFDDEMKEPSNQTKDFAKLIKQYIRNIYSQLLKPSAVKTTSYIDYLSYRNCMTYFKGTKLSLKIKEQLVSFMREYTPKLDYRVYRYILHIIDDVIGEQYVAKLSYDDRDTVYDGTYRNEYYMMLDDVERRKTGELRLPKGMGLLTNITIGERGEPLVVDENPYNNFTYEECKMWVLMPIVHPRTFKAIAIDSPLYNRLLCMSFQYDKNLIPRMITSRGYVVIYTLITRIRNILREIGKPPQSRKQLENSIHKLSLSLQPKKGILSRIAKVVFRQKTKI